MDDLVDSTSFGLLPPVDPAKCMANGCVSGEVLLAYYKAYEEFARSHRVGKSEVVGSCTSVSEPGTEPSIGSSASSGKAAKRARWRARQKVKKRDASVSTYTGAVSSPPVKVTDRPCYASVLGGSQLGFGSSVTFQELLDVAMDVVAAEDVLASLSVVRECPGMYHVTSGEGVALLKCLTSVARSAQVRFASGSLGENVLARELELPAILLEKGPKLTDRLGMKLVLRDDARVQLYDCRERPSAVGTGVLSYDPESSVFYAEPEEGEVVALVCSVPFLVEPLSNFAMIGPRRYTSRCVIVHGPASVSAKLTKVEYDGPERVVLLNGSDVHGAFCELGETLAAAGCLLGAMEHCGGRQTLWRDLRYNAARASTDHKNASWMQQLLLQKPGLGLVSRRVGCQSLSLLASLGFPVHLNRTNVPKGESSLVYVDSASRVFPEEFSCVLVSDVADREYVRRLGCSLPVVMVSEVQGQEFPSVVVVTPAARWAAQGEVGPMPRLTQEMLYVGLTRSAVVCVWSPLGKERDFGYERGRMPNVPGVAFTNCDSVGEDVGCLLFK